jgi:creatinine amidohydrolase
MPLNKLEELNYPQLDSLDRQKTLFLVAVSPLEEHGPHLPLGVDAFNAEYFLTRIAEGFSKVHPDWSLIRIPTLWCGSQVFDTVGSVQVRPRALRNLVVDSLNSLAKYGFRYFLILNAHGGPKHIVALEEAAHVISRQHGARAFSFSGHVIWSFLRGNYLEEMQQKLALSAEDAAALKQDAHAGFWETSMMLKLKPDLVDPGFRKLQPFTTKLIEKLRPNYPLKMGDRQGYVGHPARANVNFADGASEFLLEKAMQLIENALFAGSNPQPSTFYRLVVFRTNFMTVLVALLLIAVLVLLLLNLR